MGLTTMNKNRPIIITGKTGTGKTTKAKEMLPEAVVLFANEIEIDANSLNVENGLIIEDIHYNAQKDAILNIIRRYRGQLIMTSLNEKNIPKEIKALCKIKRAGTTKHLYDSIQEIAPRSEEPFSLQKDTFSLVSYFLKETDRDLVCKVLKVNKPSDTQIMNWLCVNSNPNKLLFIDGRVRRRWSQDYFYEMLAYVYDGRFYGRMNMPIRKQYSKVPSLLRRLGIKNADKRIFKQLTKDEKFVKFAKSKLNNSECRLLGLGEKRVRKAKSVSKVKQTTLGDF